MEASFLHSLLIFFVVFTIQPDEICSEYCSKYFEGVEQDHQNCRNKYCCVLSSTYRYCCSKCERSFSLSCPTTTTGISLVYSGYYGIFSNAGFIISLFIYFAIIIGVIACIMYRHRCGCFRLTASRQYGPAQIIYPIQPAQPVATQYNYPTQPVQPVATQYNYPIQPAQPVATQYNYPIQPAQPVVTNNQTSLNYPQVQPPPSYDSIFKQEPSLNY